MQKKKRFLLTLAYIAVLGALIWLAGKYLLRWLLPFFIAWIIAAVTEPLTLWCRRTLHLKRSFLSAVLTLLLTGGLAAILTALTRRLWQETAELFAALPTALSDLPDMAAHIFDRLEHFCASCPDGLRQWMEQAVQAASRQLTSLVTSVSAAGVRIVANIIAALPQIVLFCATTALAIFFTVGSYPQLTAFLRRQLNHEQLHTMQGVKTGLLSAISRWLKAECILIGITFSELLLGFLLMRQPYTLLLSALIALIDALPVFGTGTILLPWALLCCLSDNFPKGIALAALYAVITLVRSISEPKIVAAQAGLPPLAALMAMYTGFRMIGVGGMLLFPLLLLLLKQLRDSGYVVLWK